MAYINPKVNWNAQDKYNHVDLNRVENNTLEVAKLLKENIDTNLVLPTIFTTRDYSRIEFAEDLNRIETSISKLKLFPIPSWLPNKTTWKSGDSFSFIDANRLEINLQLILDNINNILGSRKYCGTFSCGEEGDIY